MSDPIRIGGFFSSFDYQSIIDKLTAARQAPINQLTAQQQKLASKQSAMNQLITKFSALLSRANTLRATTSMSGRSTSVSGSGVSASVTPSALPGSFTVSVSQLATGTTATGIPLTAAVDATSKLESSNLGVSVTAGSFTLTTNAGSQTLTVDPATQSLNDIIGLINVGPTGITASIVNDSNGRQNILQLTAGNPITVGKGDDTSNFLNATNLSASPGTTTRASTLGIARLNSGVSMATASFNGGPPVAGSHSFKINGVQIDYDVSTDSLSTVIGRINASTAGVTARYDPVADQLKLTQNKLGGMPMSMADDLTGGNFLAVTGLLNAAQVSGHEARYSIDGGPTLYANSNDVSANGVSLALTAPTTSPATVTVAQDTSNAVSSMQSFVGDFNSLLQGLNDATKADTDNPGPLSGDSALLALRSRLRSIIGDFGSNVTGRYQSMSELGLTFGAIGTAPGQANTLTFDSAKFTAALQADPASVQNAISQLTFGSSLVPGGTSSITGVAGTYLGNKTGTYAITDDGAGKLTAVFTPGDGSAATTSSVTLAGPNTTTTALIPGLTLAVGAFQTGSSSVQITRQSASVVQLMSDFLNGQAGPNGTLKSRLDEYTKVTKDLETRKAQIQSSIDAEMALLRNKFIAMEQAQAQAQSTSSALQSALLKITSSNGS